MRLPEQIDAQTLASLQRHCRMIAHLARTLKLGRQQVTLHGLFPFHGTAVTRGNTHTHAVYEAQLMLRGQAVCVTGEHQQVIEPGMMTLHAPRAPHAWHGLSGPFLRLTLWFSLAPAPPMRPCAAWPCCIEAFETLDTLLRELDARVAGWTDRVPLHAATLLSRVLTLTDRPAADIPDDRDDSALLLLLDRFLHDNLHHPVARRDVADFLGLSERTLSRQLRRLTGGTLLDRLEYLRLERARMLLEQTDAALAAICTRVGFSSPAYFCRRFRRHAGMTPGAYRRAHAR